MLTKTFLFFFFLYLAPLWSNTANITLSENPKPLIICKATAGQEPVSAIDTSTTCSIRVPSQKTIRISASLDSPMPLNTFLKMRLASPYKNSNNPIITLDCIPKNLATGIREGFHENLLITYEYSAKVAAGIVNLTKKTIILTILENESP